MSLVCLQVATESANIHRLVFSCACKEGWEGSKCETEIKLAAPAGGGDSWSSATATGTFVSVVSLLMLSLAINVA